MTREQCIAAIMLNECTFLPASFDKSFVRSIYSIAHSTPTVELTPKQAAYLEKITYRYRRQLVNVRIPSDWEVENQ
jgi:hypothetical protein